MTVKLTRIRAALVVAALATCVVGVSYAAIPAATGTISACKDNKGTLKVIDAEAGQTCNANQQLVSWNQQGPAGAQGPAGQDGVSGRQITYGKSTYDSLTQKAAVAFCPSGKVAVAGGFGTGMYSGPSYLSPQGVAIVHSRPEAYGWSVAAQEVVPTDQEWELTAWAVCVTAS